MGVIHDLFQLQLNQIPGIIGYGNAKLKLRFNQLSSNLKLPQICFPWPPL